MKLGMAQAGKLRRNPVTKTPFGVRAELRQSGTMSPIPTYDNLMIGDYEILAFSDVGDWRSWVGENHTAVSGIWMKIHKKTSGVATVTYAEALDEALCYGWIDGQKKAHDERSFLQKFTPRRSKSLWSKRNIEHVGRLTGAGLMMPSGLAEVERAKADGRWQAAYDAPVEMRVPDDFLLAVGKNPRTLDFFETLNKTDRYVIAWRLQTARTPETRQRRFGTLLKALENGEKPLA